VIRRAGTFLAATLGAGAAWAGPPYVTDDPEPTDLGKWEIYAYGDGTRFAHATEGATGFDINYGAAKDVQASAVVEVDHAGGRSGFGDLELGLKYRFVHQRAGSWVPDIALFPKIDLPTARHGFGSGHVDVVLPVWMQKDVGGWSLFGGGQYVINPGAGNRDYGLVGFAASRDISKHWNLGAEIYHQTADADDSRSTTGVRLGAEYALSEKWSLIGSAGPLIQHRSSAGQFAGYFALAFHN
jgi:hypothetical protein